MNTNAYAVASAGEEGGAVLPQAKKRRPDAVARAAAFDRAAVGAGKRDSCRRGWSGLRSDRDQSAGQLMLSSAAAFDRAAVGAGKRDS
jgi:hypothetical protein